MDQSPKCLPSSSLHSGRSLYKYYVCGVKRGKGNPSGAQCCLSQLLVSTLPENRWFSVSPFLFLIFLNLWMFGFRYFLCISLFNFEVFTHLYNEKYLFPSAHPPTLIQPYLPSITLTTSHLLKNNPLSTMLSICMWVWPSRRNMGTLRVVITS